MYLQLSLPNTYSDKASLLELASMSRGLSFAFTSHLYSGDVCSEFETRPMLH